jgi:molybdopterin converting factor small subunit
VQDGFDEPKSASRMLANRRQGCLRSGKMITFQISGHLTEFTGGRVEVEVDGSYSTAGEALDRLWKEHVGLRDRVLTELGEVRPHVNIFVNSQTVRRDQVLQTKIEGDAEICIMPAVSGGCSEYQL